MPLLTCLLLALAASPDPHADSVVDFDAGLGGSAGYNDPATALGPPTRLTVDGEVVTPFVPAWGTEDIVSIGPGGWITLAFDEPVVDHPENPYGIDLLVFGNAGCMDTNWPEGVIGGFFGADGGLVEVSPDGTAWHLVEHVTADAPWPTMAYMDAPAYTFDAGSMPSSFVRPIDPAHGLLDTTGLAYDAIVQLYDGSGGGVGIDLAPLGLGSIHFVRISVPTDAFFAPELDAIADVAPHRPGDVNLDGFIDIGDLLLVLSDWNGHGPWTDADGSGVVDIGDLLLVLAGWGASPW